MLALIPEWASNYEEFWKAIRLRNLWFIRLRYVAVIILIGFVFLGETWFHFDLAPTQTIAISSISLLIFLYNVTIHTIRKYVGILPGKFNCLHISLIQMMLDLAALMLLVYYTGLIESPLYMFFIFHMIIGSMILPGYIVYMSAGLVSVIFAVLTILERYGLIPTYDIIGLVGLPYQHTLTYSILFIIVFSFVLFVSVYFANKISRELYQREQQLRQSLEKLNEAEKAKQRYTLGIVHEIKTPITAVESILELIHEKYVGPVSKKVDQKILRAKLRTEEALDLINNILRISKLKLLDSHLNEEINLSEFIAAMVDNFQEPAKVKLVELTFKNELTKNNILISDKILFELSLSNVISNAIKYVDTEGKVEVKLSFKQDIDKFLITVCDNGIGIPANEIQNIFDQFFRASNINKAIHEGSGLGLAVVKEVVERLGGTINVKSPSLLGTKEKPGTCFEILLPRDFKPPDRLDNLDITTLENSKI
jgi:signal transduction histidine kinase